MAFCFGFEYLGFDRFSLDAFDVPTTTIRLVCSVLLQMTLNQELLEATKLLTWLKQRKITEQNHTARYVTILLCMMKMLAPFCT